MEVKMVRLFAALLPIAYGLTKKEKNCHAEQ
jgi:hypothetical protein